MPESVEIPAPVSTTTRARPLEQDPGAGDRSSVHGSGHRGTADAASVVEMLHAADAEVRAAGALLAPGTGSPSRGVPGRPHHQRRGERRRRRPAPAARPPPSTWASTRRVEQGDALRHHQPRHRRGREGVPGPHPRAGRRPPRACRRRVRHLQDDDLRRAGPPPAHRRRAARGRGARRRPDPHHRDGQDVRLRQGRGLEVRARPALVRRTRRGAPGRRADHDRRPPGRTCTTSRSAPCWRSCRGTSPCGRSSASPRRR